MKLLSIEKIGRDSKRIHFQQDKRELWNKSQSHLINPIKSFGYIDERYDTGLISSYSALSHYSMLNGEEVPTKVLTTPPNFEIYNIEDIQRIEIWKYPPIPMEEEFVDKKSFDEVMKKWDDELMLKMSEDEKAYYAAKDIFDEATEDIVRRYWHRTILETQQQYIEAIKTEYNGRTSL